jgi:hypothetical protein
LLSLLWRYVLIFCPRQLEWQACTGTPAASYWLRWGLMNYLFRMASNHDPPDLSLPGRGITGVSHQHQARNIHC